MALLVLRYPCFYLLALTLIVLPPAVSHAAEQHYRDQLIESAREQRLHQRPEWHKLLHYKPGMIPGSYKSEVDAPRFFLADGGKTDPDTELTATLAAFFAPFPNTVDEQQWHPQCLFPARYQWLKQELKIDNSLLPEHPCRRMEEWMEVLDPHGVTVIFPAAFINSPSSMYGHTLLRIDAKGQDERTRLLAYAINFGADTGNDGGLAFVLKGLLGAYPGTFSVAPYYLKVREYSDMENRDIWEYQLNLTEEEMRTMLLHTWELRGIWFDYFFFDENCSYHLLSLIETARPDLELTGHFGAWAIPSDTIRVLDDAGLIKNIVYRPSRRAVLQYRMAGLDRSRVDAVQRLAQGQISPQDEAVTSMPVEQQAEVMEIAHEYADYRMDDNDPILQLLLQARSALPVSSPRVNPPGGIRPDQGHDTGRSSLIAGREDGHDYLELELRPAYHDLLDPVPGYTPGAQIIFFSLAARHDSDAETTRLQYFTPVNIVSLTPVTDIATPISWQFNFGLTRKQGQQHNRMLATVNGGAGISAAPFENSIAYALFTLGLDVDNEELRKGYAAGVGGDVGLLMEMSPAWTLHLFAHGTDYTAGEVHNEYRLGLGQRYTVGRSDTVRMEWTRQQQLGGDFNNFNLSWQHFF